LNYEYCDIVERFNAVLFCVEQEIDGDTLLNMTE